MAVQLIGITFKRKIEMRIAIAGDSVGISLVNVLLPHLQGLKGVEVTDMSQSPTGATGEYYANIAERVAGRTVTPAGMA